MSYQFELVGGPRDGDYFEGEELPYYIRYPTKYLLYYYRFSVEHLAYVYSHWSFHGTEEENYPDSQDFKPSYEEEDPYPYEDEDFFKGYDEASNPDEGE